MKDIEKIKSEDLGCQVQDANPANFAIEQEVAQLVGATVPAPTEPSADDARELGAQLLVFLRRALLPIRSALRTAVADIYAHLDSRCTAYTPAAYDPFRLPAGPYDPMRPFVPRTLPNLLQAITAFSDRKITGVPEAADGMSLLHLFNDTSAITELTDDNQYTMLSSKMYSALQLFPQLEKIQFGCSVWNTNYVYLLQSSAIEEVDFPNLVEITKTSDIRDESKAEIYCTNLSSITFPKLKKINYAGWNTPLISSSVLKKIEMPELEEFIGSTYYVKIIGGANNYDNSVEDLIMPKLKSVTVTSNNGSNFIGCCNQLKKVEMGTLVAFPTGVFGACPLLTDLRIGEGTAISLNLADWNSTDKGTTFLQNFKDHIALRLTANGSGLTLTLSQAVRDAIHAAEATYGIEAIIVTQKGWTLSPAPGASSQ